jgi:hypothetical protein
VQCARANQKNNRNASQSCFVKYGNMEQHPPRMCNARPTQTQMGMSDQTLGRIITPKCKDPNARISAKSKIHSNLSLMESIGNTIEKAIQKVQAQIRSC